MTSGADPLFFLDYIGSQKLEPDTMVEIVDGMARACKENGCALIGGETAEMPGFYAPNEYDLVGAIVGIVDKDKIIDGSNIQENDILIGLPSNGFHTNGYSLIRKVLLEIEKKDITQIEPDLGTSWGEVLLKVHKSYKSIIQNLRELPGLVGISHITGGGIEGNTSRLLNEETTLYIDYSAWDMPGEFKLLQQYGNISDNEMKRVFNCGIGLILVINANHLNEIEQKMRQLGEEYYIIGRIEHK
jgi:phosphoribosylformylglycinamidine cyclo-ligase